MLRFQSVPSWVSTIDEVTIQAIDSPRLAAADDEFHGHADRAQSMVALLLRQLSWTDTEVCSGGWAAR